MIEDIVQITSLSNNASPRGGFSPTGIGSHEGSDSGAFVLEYDER